MEDKSYLLSKLAELEERLFILEQKIAYLGGGVSEEPDILEAPRSFRRNSISLCSESPKIKSKRTERFILNGDEDHPYGKSRLVLAVIRQYVSADPSLTFSQLSSAFPKEKTTLNSFDCVKRLQDVTDSQRSPVKRYFVDDPIRLSDGTKVTVCTQWGSGNISSFIELAESYGFDIKLKQ